MLSVLLSQVSYGSSSPALSNKKDFPRFLRLEPPENLQNPAKVAIMKLFNWRHVATIHEPVPLFSKVKLFNVFSLVLISFGSISCIN